MTNNKDVDVKILKAIKDIEDTAKNLTINKKVKKVVKPKKKKNKLNLNIKRLVFKNIIQKFQIIKQNIIKFFHNGEIKELQAPIKHVIGYGLLGWPVLYTFFNYKFDILYVIGAGAMIYLVYDAIDYIKDMIVEIKKKR